MQRLNLVVGWDEEGAALVIYAGQDRATADAEYLAHRKEGAFTRLAQYRNPPHHRQCRPARQSESKAQADLERELVEELNAPDAPEPKEADAEADLEEAAFDDLLQSVREAE
jgi:hypothetical protein